MGSVHAKSMDRPEESVALALGNIKAKVQRVHIEGLNRTKDDIVINSVSDVFSANDFKSVVLRLHEARERLENLGCFSEIGIFIDTYKEIDASNNGIQVTFNVKETNLLGGTISTNFGNNEGSVSIVGRINNVFGRGEKFFTEVSRGSKKSSSFHSKFRKPFHNAAGTELTADVYQQAMEVPWSGFKDLDKGFLVSLAFMSSPNVQQKFILDNVWKYISCLSRSTTFAVREHAGHSLKSSVKHEIHYDDRDNNIFPTEGRLLSLKNEFAGIAGDVGFMKSELNLQVNLPIPKALVLQGSFQAGHLTPLNNSKTHTIADRFFLGGPSSIRGFEMAGIGPHSEGASLGARTFWASGLHIHSPLPLLKSGSYADRFRLHGFVNVGNIGNFNLSGNYKNKIETLMKDMRLSYGAGLSLNLAGIATVEFNYCVPLVFVRSDRSVHGFQFGLSTTLL